MIGLQAALKTSILGLLAADMIERVWKLPTVPPPLREGGLPLERLGALGGVYAPNHIDGSSLLYIRGERGQGQPMNTLRYTPLVSTRRWAVDGGAEGIWEFYG